MGCKVHIQRIHSSKFALSARRDLAADADADPPLFFCAPLTQYRFLPALSMVIDYRST
jgi:hypothetical protein